MKKRIICCIIYGMLIFSLMGCSAFNHDSSESETSVESVNNISSKADEGIGEIRFTQTEQEHIVKTDDGVMYADNEILIVVKEETDYYAVQQLANQYSAEIVGMIEFTGDYQLQFPNVYAIDELEKIAEEIQSESFVEDAYADFFFNYETESLKYGKDWEEDLQNYKDLKGKSWGIEAIKAPQAWEMLENNKSKVNPVRLGLIDDGFYLNHEDLKDCFVETFYNYDSDLFLNQDEFSKKIEHGTHVAGTMAANSDNDSGICGVYPYGKGNLYGASYKNSKNQYSENSISCMAEKCCYAELIIRNVKVINCSYGSDSNLVELYHFQKDMRERAAILEKFLLKFIDKGYDFVIVQAAGNFSNECLAKLKYDDNDEVVLDNGKASYDENGDYTKVYYQNGGLAVKGWYYNGKKINNLSTNYNDEKVLKFGYRGAEYTSPLMLCSNEKIKNRIIVVGAIEKDNDNNFMLCDFSNYKDYVDVYAPGKNIYSSVPFKMVGSSLYFYDTKDGTSMAAPHVTGLAASVWAANNQLSGEQVKQIVCDTATEKDCFMISIGEKIPEKLKVVNMEKAIAKALGIETEEESTVQNNGSIMCWVVEKGSDNKLSNVTVIAKDAYTNEIIEQTSTDSNGHFELILPEGKYILTVKEDSGRYDDYTSEVIEVANQSVNYLNDWIKLTRKTTELSQYLGTNIDDFLAMMDNLQKVDISDGSLEYRNSEIIISARPDSKLIDFISICGNSDYSLYGLWYGMLFSETDNLISQEIASVKDNKSDYKYINLNNDTDISFHADTSGVLDSVSVFGNAPISEPDVPVVSSMYKENYKSIITALSFDDSINTIDYTLYDMNADDIPELVLKAGSCEADYKLSFYTYRENIGVISVGDNFSGFHTTFYVDKTSGSLCTQWGQMGIGGIAWYNFDGNSVSEFKRQDNIEYATQNVNFDNYEDAYAPYGDFSSLKTVYCFNSWNEGWVTFENENSKAGIDFSLIDNY